MKAAGSADAYSQTPDYGVWDKKDGSRVSMLCPKEYNDVNRIPEGCVVGLEGGGILFTSSAYSENEADLIRAKNTILGLEKNLKSLRGEIKRLTDVHKAEIVDLTLKSESRIKDVVKSSSTEKAQSLTYGILAGTVFGFLLCLFT